MKRLREESGEREEDGEIQAMKINWRPEGAQGLLTLKTSPFMGHISRVTGGFHCSLAVLGDATLTFAEIIKTPEIWKFSQNQGGLSTFFL